MSEVKSELHKAMEEHGHAIDAIHQKLAAMPGCDKARLEGAVAKLKAAHQAFHDDALACVGF
jgi:cell division FtsZ-interacting protein ZapD